MMRAYGMLVWSGVLLLTMTGRGMTADSPVSIVIDKDHGKIDFKVNKALVSSYHYGPSVAKPYFWPLNAPGEITVTRGWPMVKGLPGETTDHVHQKSAWFCHGDIIPEGIEYKKHLKDVKGVDFWSERPGHGKIVCVEAHLEGKNPGSASTRNEWRTAEGTKILDETRVIQLRDLGTAYLLVIDIDLHASVCPLTFGDTKEGSMGVRVNDLMTEKAKGGILTNAESKKGEKEVWGYKSVWCDYSGQVPGPDKKTVTAGIALFEDAKNELASCWHSRGYGLMAANPFGRKGAGFPAMKENETLFTLDKGKHLKLRYGILVHTGDAEGGKVAEHYKAFATGKE